MMPKASSQPLLTAQGWVRSGVQERMTEKGCELGHIAAGQDLAAVSGQNTPARIKPVILLGRQQLAGAVHRSQHGEQHDDAPRRIEDRLFSRQRLYPGNPQSLRWSTINVDER